MAPGTTSKSLLSSEYSHLKKDELLNELNHLSQKYKQLDGEMSRIVDIGSGIIYVIDPDGHFTFLNSAVEEILHYQPRELLGQHFSCIMPQHEYQRVSREHVLPGLVGKATGPNSAPKLFNERRTKQRRTRNLEVQLLTKEHKSVNAVIGDVMGIVAAEGAYDLSQVKSGSLRDDGFLGSQGIIYDITQYKQLEQEKRELEKRLIIGEQITTLGRFAGAIAHELNNKLSAVIGFNDIVKKKYLPQIPDMADCIDNIHIASHGAADLTAQLLEFSRHRAMHKSPMLADDIMKVIRQLIRPMISKQIQLKEFFRAGSLEINAEQHALQHAFLSLAMVLADQIKNPGDLVFATKKVDVDSDLINKQGLVNNPGRYVIFSFIATGLEEKSEYKALLIKTLESGTYIEAAKLGVASLTATVKENHGFMNVTVDSSSSIRVDVYLPSS